MTVTNKVKVFFFFLIVSFKLLLTFNCTILQNFYVSIKWVPIILFLNQLHKLLAQ